MLCVFMVEGMSVGVYVMLSLMSVISPPPDLCGLSARQSCMLVLWGFFLFRGELGFLNCDDVCMRVFDESFELLEFVVHAVYVDLQNDQIFLVITARSVNACGVCSVYSPSCPSYVKTWINPVHVSRLCG